MPGKNPMTPAAAADIQSSQAKSGGDMSSSGFAARAQGAGARNANNANNSSNQGGNANNTQSTNNGSQGKK
ncbi:hypothetical protein MN608_11228 [Microdochium nivale]|nr:hypothetical protein MN608_11228 [Microdochium nivale]